jgi:WD40 repeat protein/serine/threonine protein kinase
MKQGDDRTMDEDRIQAAKVNSEPSVPNPASTGGLEDPHVIRALEEYRAALEAGGKCDRDEFLARYPEIAPSLAECLDGLDFVHQAASHWSQPAIPDTALPAAEIQPEGPLGDFRIVREVGRGGMGVVYEAVQISLGRKVALKVLPFAAALDAKQLQRFKNEAQAAGQLHHTHIVPVHAVGCERGVHFYAMQFIEGQTLAQLIQELRGLAGHGAAAAGVSRSEASNGRETPATVPQQVGATGTSTTSPSFFRSVARLGVQAAEALDYAHGEGVIHRDIKPANLLVDGKGQLWITDFGLARCRDSGGLTMTGDVVGTLRYMSPEQALGKRPLVDHRTDIYSLGVTLYELATLEPAFCGSDRGELLQQIAYQEPPPPRQRNKAIPRELETILLKALEKSPDARYATAQELADDLRRFLEHKPIQAKRPTRMQRLSKWCRRNPLLAAALTMVAATLLLGTVVAWLLAAWALNEKGRAKEEAERAREAETKAKWEAEQASRQAYAASIPQMQQAWESHHLLQLQNLLARTAESPYRGFEWYYLQRLSHVEHLTLVGHTGGLLAVAFAPDGHRLLTGGKDGTARMWDASTGRELFCLRGHANHVTAVAFAPDGQWFVTGSADGTARLWDAARGRPLRTLQSQPSSPIWAVAVTPDGRRVVTGRDDGTARVWDAARGQELLSLDGHSSLANIGASTVASLIAPQAPAPLLAASALYPRSMGHTRAIWAVAVTPDGKRLITTGYDDLVILWDAASGRKLRSWIGNFSMGKNPGVHGVVVMPDGRRLITVSGDNSAHAWDADTGTKLCTLRRETGWVLSAAVSPDGQWLMTGHTSGAARIWQMVALPDIGASTVGLLSVPGAGGPLLAASVLYEGRTNAISGREIGTLMGHTNAVTCVAVSPDGQRLATANLDGTARVWDLSSGRPTRTLKGHNDEVCSVAVTPDGQQVITGSIDDTVRVWDITSGRQLRKFDAPTGGVSSVAVTPNGQRIVAATFDGTARVWDAVSGQKLQEFKDITDIWSMALTPDGQRLVTAVWTKAQLWDLASGQKLPTSFKGPTALMKLAVAPDGQQLVMGCWNDGTTRLFDITTGQELRTLPDHSGSVSCVAVTPDSRRVITGSSTGTVTVWDKARGQEVFYLIGHTDMVTSIAVTPDGQRIVTGSFDGTVRLWDTTNGRELLILNAKSGPVLSVAVTPDGRQLVVGCADGTAKIWEAATPAQSAFWAEQDQEVERRRAAWERPVPDAPGFIHDWLVLAPLALQDHSKGAKALACELVTGEAGLQPRAGRSVQMGGRKGTWVAHHEEKPILDFGRLVGRQSDDSAAYAVCYVISAAERHDLLLQVGSGGRAKVYLNGQEVYRYSGPRDLWDLDPAGPVRLREGTNVLVFKVLNDYRDRWQGCARFVDGEGNPAEGLRYSLTPE